MRRLAPALAALALAACEAKPKPQASAPSTTIQHDQPAQLPAGPLPPGADASQLPPDHPNLGDGATTHDAPAGHPAVAGQEDVDAKALLAKVEAMKEELKSRPKSIEVTVALGSLYYDNGRYLDAIDYYRQAVAQGDDLVKGYKAIAQAAGNAKTVDLAKAGCDRGVLKDSEPILAKAQAYKSQGKLPEALSCAREAVRPVVMAHARRGNAFYLVGNPSSAVAEHEAALQLDPDNAESLFFRGAIYFDAMGDDVAKLKLAEASWKHFLEVAGDSPRGRAVREMLPQLQEAIRLGGVSKLPRPQNAEVADNGQPGPGGAAPLDQGAAEAIQNTEITPELIQGFGQILDQATGQVAKGDVEGARTNLVRVFPFVMADMQSGAPKVPSAMRAKAMALMSLYMASKGAPMAGPLAQQAVGADAKSVDALADALKAQGDAAHARTLWSAVVTGAPDYAKGANISAKLQ